MHIDSISPGLSALVATSSAASEELGPKLLYAGDGSPWTPQGQGYLEGTGGNPGQILTTYSGGRDDGVLLSMQDLHQSPDSDADHAVILGGLPSTTFGASQPAPDKAGGVATDGTHVYVADTEAIYVYRLSDIQASRGDLCGEPVPAIDRIEMPDGTRASYLNIKDGKLYVGEFASTVDALKDTIEVEGLGEQLGDFFKAINPLKDKFKDYFTDPLDALSPVELHGLDRPEMLVYNIDESTGGVIDEGTGEVSSDKPEPEQSFEIPFDTQGVAIADEGLLFTRSYGSLELNVGHGIKIEAPHELTFLERDGSADGYEAAADAGKVAELDYYAEGVNIIDGQVWVTYESAADKYRDKVDDPREHIQRIPLEDLDIPDAG